MDYEKKYKKLVGKIEKAYLYAQTDSTKAVLEEICHELKESEDGENKRISKEITQFLKQNNGWNIEWLDWLEKQGGQKEYTFKSLPRLLDMIEPTGRAKAYCQKLIDSLLQEGYTTDAKIVSDCLKQMNGEKVALATMDEKQDEKEEVDGFDA